MQFVKMMLRLNFAWSTKCLCCGLVLASLLSVSRGSVAMSVSKLESLLQFERKMENNLRMYVEGCQEAGIDVPDTVIK